MLPMQTASFYGFRPKTVRSPSQNRMFLVRKPYGFGTENLYLSTIHWLIAYLTNYRIKSKQFLILQNGLLLHCRDLCNGEAIKGRCMRMYAINDGLILVNAT